MDLGNILTTILTGAAALFVPWISQRIMPASRWNKQIERDLNLLKLMEAGKLSTLEFQSNVDAQVRRLAAYKKGDVGGDFWLRRIVVAFCLLYIAATGAVIAWSATLTKDPLSALGSVPIILWVFILVDIALLLFITSGDVGAKLNHAKVVAPKKNPWWRC
ncbi:hypothetical protein I8920_03925 [Curtobacterium sp. YC1]|uniref:hypothetical protein n=1 Tax=Curtobacterium sp. YC1 TaxID=2795488 RepID=UPI0018E4FBB4|nr:hypothetical protein [Curtobacterium sp. YC1]QQD76916.1 hypothetical protein I8920_03925 [Curtobacterium sp. YC1]